jgi:hypothetical protein
MLFWASLAPCEKARKAEVRNCERRNHFVHAGLGPGEDRHHELLQQEADPEADDRRDDQADEDLGDTVDLAVGQLGESPLHVAGAGRQDRGAHQPADEGVRGRGRDAEPPGAEVPRDGPDDAAEHDDHRGLLRQGAHVDELADRVGHGRATEDRPEEFESRDDDDRLDGGHRARRDGRSDDVRGVVEAVRVVEDDDENDRDGCQNENRVHARVTMCAALLCVEFLRSSVARKYAVPGASQTGT